MRLQRGWSEGIATVSTVFGVLTGIFALFNFFIQTFSLPYHTIAEPIVVLWTKYIIPFIEQIDIRVKWLVPDWDPSLYALLVIGTTLLSRTFWKSVTRLSPSAPFYFIATIEVFSYLIVFVVMILYAIPYFNIIIAAMIVLIMCGIIVGFPPFSGSRWIYGRWYLRAVLLGTVVTLTINYWAAGGPS